MVVVKECQINSQDLQPSNSQVLELFPQGRNFLQNTLSTYICYVKEDQLALYFVIYAISFMTIDNYFSHWSVKMRHNFERKEKTYFYIYINLLNRLFSWNFRLHCNLCWIFRQNDVLFYVHLTRILLRVEFCKGFCQILPNTIIEVGLSKASYYLERSS